MNENKFSANEGIISMINEEQQPSVIFANEFDDITCEVNIIQATIDVLLALSEYFSSYSRRFAMQLRDRISGHKRKYVSINSYMNKKVRIKHYETGIFSDIMKNSDITYKTLME